MVVPGERRKSRPTDPDGSRKNQKIRRVSVLGIVACLNYDGGAGNARGGSYGPTVTVRLPLTRSDVLAPLTTIDALNVPE